MLPHGITSDIQDKFLFIKVTMSLKVPKEYLEARRTEILKAAYKCFIEKGFHYTTMRDIYQATNLSPGAVYNHFPSKEDIVIATLLHFNDWAVSSITSWISENANEALISFIRFWLSQIEQEDISNGFIIQLDFYSEATRNEVIRKSLLKNQDAIHASFTEFVKQNQEAGVFNDRLDPLAITRTIMGMLFGIMIHKILEPEVDLEAYGQVFESIFNGTFTNQVKR
jgi:TetR/AcrR family transcriptional repressor of uid operon